MEDLAFTPTQWPDLCCANTWIPGIMVFGAMTKFGTRECSYSKGPDRLGQ